MITINIVYNQCNRGGGGIGLSMLLYTITYDIQDIPDMYIFCTFNYSNYQVLTPYHYIFMLLHSS